MVAGAPCELLAIKKVSGVLNCSSGSHRSGNRRALDARQGNLILCEAKENRLCRKGYDWIYCTESGRESSKELTRKRISAVVTRSYQYGVLAIFILALGQRIWGADAVCAPKIAALPTTRLSPLGTMPARFELRQCSGSISVQVLLFEVGKSKPTIFVDTHEPWKLLVHHSNLLIMQTVGGSSSVVYVFRFQRGKAQQPITVDTRGLATVRIDDERNKVFVDIPADERPTITVPARTLEFNRE